MLSRLSSLPLMWRVFATNAAVLVLAFLGLVFAPVTVSVPPHLTELIVLVVGLFVMLAINLLLLRPAFRPLDELAETMKRHDPLTPGVRVRVDGEPDVAALARTFNDMLDRLESERRDSARRALMVQEGERRRIARELHDEVGQTLTGVMLQVESLAAVIPDELREQLDELRETARQGTEEVRRIARRLRPEALEDLGLQSALAALAGSVGEQAHIRIDRHLDPRLSLSEQQELVVYRVAQEALTNVARHAGARRADLRLERDDAHAVLIVRDDGRGLGPTAVSSSHGILGMRERAMLIGAQIAIGAAPGGGNVLKSAVDRDLVEACRAAMRGEPFLYPGGVRALMREYLERARAGEAIHGEMLTPREEEIVKLVAEAHTNDEIADMLVISKKTVERHRANILEKLGMRDRVELTRYAIRRGLVQP